MYGVASASCIGFSACIVVLYVVIVCAFYMLIGKTNSFITLGTAKTDRCIQEDMSSVRWTLNSANLSFISKVEY